jgi:F-type H+-transporting ATPase subunit delta
MSETLTLARPYARAAFESARAGNALRAWSDGLRFSAQAVADTRVGALIGNPRLDSDELVGLLLPPSEAAGSPFASFLSLLADNSRLVLLPDIAALFEELKRDAEHVLKVTLRSATEIPQSQADAIKVALAKRFGRDIELEQRIDPSVIGGAVIDAGDVVIDGSVRGRLARLENALLQ